MKWDHFDILAKGKTDLIGISFNDADDEDDVDDNDDDDDDIKI